MSTYNDIQGWFDFPDIYERAISEAPPGSSFVEIGTWRGKSAIFMADKISKSKKEIEFYVVDTFLGSDVKVCRDIIASMKTTLFEDFKQNVKSCGVEGLIKPLVKTSVEASLGFRDDSLFFAFIDADHGYKSVCEDLKAWYPKIIPGGVLAGHDYVKAPGVQQAVNELVTRNQLTVHLSKNSWWIRKPK